MPDVAATPDESELLQQLLRLDRRARLVALANSLGLAFLAVSGIVAAAIVADSLWELTLRVRIGLLATAAVAALGGCAWAFGRSMLRRSDPAAAAALIESLHPELHERLSSAIEFEQEGASGSPLMRALVARQAAQSLESVDLAAPLPVMRTTRRGALGAAVLLALLAPCLFFGGYRLLLQRFATPWKNLDRAANLYFEVIPGDATVSRGADVEIAAAPQWRFARTEVATASLHWQDASGNRFERQMTWQAERSAFVATVSDVLQPFDFEISGGHARTRAYHVDVVDRPMLLSVTATVEPPAYSGRAVQQYEGAIGELQMQAGSRLLLEMQFNQTVDRVILHWMPDRMADEPTTEPVDVPGALNPDGFTAVVEFRPDRNGRFALQLFDAIGLANSHDPHRRIRIVADAPPTIRFADRVNASQAGPTDVLRLPVEATDDIGLAALDLHFAVDGEGKQQGQIDSGLPLLGVRKTEHEFTLDLQPLGLSNGMILSVRARTTDERPTPGPNESWTEPRLITISDEADPYDSEALAQRQQELAQALQRLRTTVAENHQTTQKLQAQAAQQQPGAAFEGDGEVAAVAEADRESAAEAERLAALFDLHPLLTTLGERARNVAQSQLTAAAEHSQSAHDAPLSDKAAALEAADKQLADASAELDAMQRDLESLAELEQDLLELQRLADDAERLAQDVAGLEKSDSEATEPTEQPADTDSSPRGREADRLRNDHADLSRRLENLLDRRPELLDAAAEASLDQLDAMREQALHLAERQQRLAEGLQGESEPVEPDPQQVAAQGELAAQQAEVVQRAVQMAHAAADSGGRDAEALRDVAEQSARATESLASGDLAAAAESARQAAEQAAALAAQPDRGGNPEETSRDELNDLAAQQQTAAQELADAANSAAARAAARQQGQQRLSDSTQQLEQDFRRIAERLASEPLSRAEDGARASESSSATEQAGGFMAESTAAQQRSDLTAATEAATAAAAQLAMAAEQALAATSNATDSPVPTDVGEQVAQASQQLRRAGEQLGDTPPGESSANMPDDAESASRDDEAGGEQQAAAETPMGEPATPQAENEEGKGQAESGTEASDFAQAAAALHAAAQRLKPRAPGDQQAPSESGMSQQPGAKSDSQSAAEGSGTTETARLAELAAKIKARSMRNWGELPGELQSELQQRTQTRPDADYAPLIRMYFDEISRQPSPATAEPP